jgi:hypothetical protein
MSKISTGGPTTPTPELVDPVGADSAHDVEEGSGGKPPSATETTDTMEVSGRSVERAESNAGASPPELVGARPSLTSLNVGNAASVPVSRGPDEPDSESIMLDDLNLGESTDTGPSFEMTPAVVGAASAGVEISADDGVVEITEGETFGDPFDARWEILHPGVLAGLTPRSPDSAFEGPPLTGDPIRLRFRLKEPAPGRVFNVRVPGPELSRKDAIRAQAKNAAKVMDRLGNGGLGRFKKVQLEPDGEMNVLNPQFKEGEDLHQEFGVLKAERLEFTSGNDAVLHHIGGRVDTGHKDYFRDRIFDPRFRDKPSKGTPSDNEGEALAKSIRKACVHGGLVIGDGASPVPEATPTRDSRSLEEVRGAIEAAAELPAVDRPYDSRLQRVREEMEPDNKRKDEVVEMVGVVEGHFKAVSAAREALEREQEALAREAGAEGPNLGVLKERLADYQKQRRDYEFGLAAFKDDCEEFVPFLERLLKREV